ncbi:uncharacterized protein F5147DRAFT_777523 [Suillus discolor]|uniref:Uncharacterized protein n=1 Tax=Suillus discolor TaxID=1912936 RepID=A0A9P7F109_9AGAM|nr:uncharacterized protein F5147DRAFT_777523 [Suillus discolor]KAG2099001.1 hypothetical protein F5147DRAFT_777523 [Suillus discolor]
MVLNATSQPEGSPLSAAQVEAVPLRGYKDSKSYTVLAASAAPNSASTGRLAAVAASNNPRFWDPKIHSEQWYDTHSNPFTIQFPAMIEPTGKHSRLDPYFSLPTLKQLKLRDVRTVKVQFQLRTLDEDYPTEAVVCSKKAVNTLMLLVSQCEAARGKDNHDIIQFLRNVGNSSADLLHFVLHLEPLLPEAGEVRREVVPKFSLEDFENTDLVFSGTCIDPDGELHRRAQTEVLGNTRYDVGWKSATDTDVSDLPDPHGHYHTMMDLFHLENVPVVVPNVRDANGALIHPADYSKIFTSAMPVVAEIVMRMWMFAPDGKREKGSRIYQTTLKSLKLLPKDEPGMAPLGQGAGRHNKRQGQVKGRCRPRQRWSGQEGTEGGREWVNSLLKVHVLPEIMFVGV